MKKSRREIEKMIKPNFLLTEMDWVTIAEELNKEGFVKIPELLNNKNMKIDEFYSDKATSSDAVTTPDYLNDLEMEDGENSQIILSNFINEIFYDKLHSIADDWSVKLGESYHDEDSYGSSSIKFNNLSKHLGKLNIFILNENDNLPLQQHSRDSNIFPFKLVGLLSTPSCDFTGGELVMVEQRPRMQSRAIVVPVMKGDVAIVATYYRPIKKNGGYYRALIKNGISIVRSGKRIGWEIMYD